MRKVLLVLASLCCLPVVLTSQVGTHSIETIADSGGVIFLDDESVWGIQVVDRADSGVWLESDDVMVKRTNEDPNYPYLLINTDEHDSSRKVYGETVTFVQPNSLGLTVGFLPPGGTGIVSQPGWKTGLVPREREPRPRPLEPDW